VKHWRNAAMALRWTAAAMQEAAKPDLDSTSHLVTCVHF